MNRTSTLSGLFSKFERIFISVCIAALLFSSWPISTVQAVNQFTIAGPAGSVHFGTKVLTLPNGNLVVTDPDFTGGEGAVYLYNGKTRALISTLTGSHQNDHIGFGVVVLENGNFVASSSAWSYQNGNKLLGYAGAVTWCSASTGCQGPVSPANSLVGSQAGDNIGFAGIGITLLSNGNFVVPSTYHSNFGSATWCSGTKGCSGFVSPSNSLIGSLSGDWEGGNGYILPLKNGNYLYRGVSIELGTWSFTLCNGSTGCVGNVALTNSLVGRFPPHGNLTTGINELSNGNYLITSRIASIGGSLNVGSVTFCTASGGCTGEVSASNSLVGSQPNDYVGGLGPIPLDNGSYVVTSPDWANGSAVSAGAITWCSGTTGCKGVVSASNSRVGTSTNDKLGYYSVKVLDNGGFVADSPTWTNGSFQNAGAVTWCNGISACVGEISAINSLVGGHSGDGVGYITVLKSGDYVVSSPDWENGTVAAAGAVTWCNGSIGCQGFVSPSNSLVGTFEGDKIGIEDHTFLSGIKELSNGAYLVESPYWNNNTFNYQAGAVTWCSGNGGCQGEVSASNSLVGPMGGSVGTYLTLLTNGNYVVTGLNNGSGSVTFCNGSTGCKGIVSASNSLVGDHIGSATDIRGVIPLKNGDYVSVMPDWSESGFAEGAVTWCSGTTGCQGIISANNSLVGQNSGDAIGDRGITKLSNGDYVVGSPSGAYGSAGSVTWCSGDGGCKGTVSADNSLIGDGIVVSLPNGNYLVASGYIDGNSHDVGAITLCSGSGGCRGLVSTANSLVGNFLNDLNAYDIEVLKNGNYIVATPSLPLNNVPGAGGVTWCSGTGGCQGLISTANTLGGSHANDQIGFGGVTELSNGNLVIESPYWTNGSTQSAGAVTFMSGFAQSAVGPLTSENSVLAKNAGGIMTWAFDAVNGLFIVGSPADNLVTLLSEPVTSTSIASGNWSDAATWDHGVPVSGTNVTIHAGHTVKINNDTTQAKDLTIQSGGSLTFGAGTLSLAGNFKNQGSFSAGSGTLAFFGGGIQTLDASGHTTFNKLLIQPWSTLIELPTQNFFTYQGTLDNRGIIRKNLAVTASGILSFGLTGVQAEVTTAGGLTNLQVDRVGLNPPDSDDGHTGLDTRNGVYWSVSATASGVPYNLSLRLPRVIGPAPVSICSHTAAPWDCGTSGSDSSSVWRAGLSSVDGIWTIGWQPNTWDFLPAITH